LAGGGVEVFEDHSPIKAGAMVADKRRGTAGASGCFGWACGTLLKFVFFPKKQLRISFRGNCLAAR
jgi:hypothetical protein